MDLVINVALFNAPGEDKEIQDELEAYSGYSGEAMDDLLKLLKVNSKKRQRKGKENQERKKIFKRKVPRKLITLNANTIRTFY